MMSETHKVYAPAKINLSLRILGKREDGFHELETLMVQLPGLADELIFSPADAWSLTCNDTTVPVDESNLVTKARLAIEEASGRQMNFDVHLKKWIPHGAGLAGGSSDAAITLKTLNELSGAKLPLEALHELALQLGSDVPFFLQKEPMWCRGRGERLESATKIPSCQVILFKPSFGVSTPSAYRAWSDSKEVPGFVYSEQQVNGVSLINDLERPVFEKHLFLGELKNWLLDQEGVMAAMMSGSGSTVFAVTDHTIDSDQLIQKAKRELDPTLWVWSGGV